MKRPWSHAKFAGVNVFVFLVLVWSSNLLASLIVDGVYLPR